MKRSTASKRRLWVVEIKDGRSWDLTVGVGLSRQDGRRELDDWRLNNPTDEFRLVQYELRRLRG